MPKRKKKRSSSWPPKGAYPLPDGNYGLNSESIIDGTLIKITGVSRAKPDTRAIAVGLIELAERGVVDGPKKTSED